MSPPAFRFGPRKGGSTPNRGGRSTAVPSLERRAGRTALKTPSPPTSVSQSGNNRKRPGDGVVDENASKFKRRKTLITTPSPSTGDTPASPIVITDDPPEASSPGFERHVKSTFPVPSESRPAPRYSTPFNPSTPTQEKHEVIVISDDEDDSTTPSNSTLRNATDSGVTTSPFGLTTPKTPSASRQFIDNSLQRPERKHGQARPANFARDQGASVSPPAIAQRSPTFRTPFHSGQLTPRSPGASKVVTAPSKSAPAQEDCKSVVPANFAVPELEVDQGQLRRERNSVPRAVVRDGNTGFRKIDDETKNRDSERAGDGRADAGGANRIGSDADHDETENVSQTDPFKESRALLSPATPGATQLQGPSGLTVPAQAQKQSEVVGDGRSDGGDRRARVGSPSLRSDNGHKKDPKGKQLPRTPRRREKKRLMVDLRAPPHKLRRISLRPVQRPEIPTGTCFLIQMPLEIQENIFKYLLLATDPIQVLEQWSKLYRGRCWGLHLSILRTCKTMFKNASAFLYGRNVFQYLVRDQPQHGAPQSSDQDDYDIKVEKYIPLFRRLELQIERRTDSAYFKSLSNAICLLNDHGADLHTLALDVSPSVEGDTLSIVGYFYRDGEIVEALKALRTCFITVRVKTPKTEDEPANHLRRRVLDMRTELGVFEEGPKQSPATQLDDLTEMITFACLNPYEVIEQGLFEEFVELPRLDERHARTARMAYFDNDGDDDVGDADDDDDGDGDYVD